MTFTRTRGVRLGLMLAAAGTFMANHALAQTRRPAQLPPGAVVQALPADDGAELRRHLTTLAEDPRAIEALIGAGRAALASGDTQAALTFFSRAAEVSPRDGRVKAGMASVLVRMERGQPALNLFAEAVALGAPQAEIAGDRGLAYDMIGNPRRAQQDYALVLQQREDPEVRRRLALSLAISGEREGALRVIDAQLRRNDRAAWRTQAFILALTGDAAGANRTAQGLMPAASAQAMAPFFARLAALSPSQKAMAAHFGRFPTQTGPALANSRQTGAAPAAPGPADDARQGGSPTRERTQRGTAASTSPRRRPGSYEGTPRRTTAVPPQQGRTRESASSTSGSRSPVQLAQAGTVRNSPAEPGDDLAPSEPRPVQPLTSAAGTGAQNSSGDVAQPVRTAPSTQNPSITPAPVVGASSRPTSSASAGVDRQARAIPGSALQAAPSRSAQGPAASGGLSDIAAVVASLPQDSPAEAGSRPSASSVPANSRASGRETSQAASGTGRSRQTRPAHPARHWVQIAGGANAAGLPRELARLRAQAPELADQNAWVTPANATNRLLVGPFASAAEAQAFVNSLARRNVSAFAWQSEAGQEIARLRAGR